MRNAECGVRNEASIRRHPTSALQEFHALGKLQVPGSKDPTPRGLQLTTPASSTQFCSAGFVREGQ
jgi:hypothetical protein